MINASAVFHGRSTWATLQKQSSSSMSKLLAGESIFSKSRALRSDKKENCEWFECSRQKLTTRTSWTNGTGRYVGFYTLCALKSPVCIETTVLVHGTVDFCVQYHALMHTGDFKLFRGMLVGQHFEPMSLAHWPAHLKFVHNHLPLGNQMYKCSPVKDPNLRLCPCCHLEEENISHFLHWVSNQACAKAISDFTKTTILSEDPHPSTLIALHSLLVSSSSCEAPTHWSHHRYPDTPLTCNPYWTQQSTNKHSSGGNLLSKVSYLTNGRHWQACRRSITQKWSYLLDEAKNIRHWQQRHCSPARYGWEERTLCTRRRKQPTQWYSPQNAQKSDTTTPTHRIYRYLTDTTAKHHSPRSYVADHQSVVDGCAESKQHVQYFWEMEQTFNKLSLTTSKKQVLYYSNKYVLYFWVSTNYILGFSALFYSSIWLMY